MIVESQIFTNLHTKKLIKEQFKVGIFCLFLSDNLNFVKERLGKWEEAKTVVKIVYNNFSLSPACLFYGHATFVRTSHACSYTV